MTRLAHATSLDDVTVEKPANRETAWLTGGVDVRGSRAGALRTGCRTVFRVHDTPVLVLVGNVGSY